MFQREEPDGRGKMGDAEEEAEGEESEGKLLGVRKGARGNA